MYNNKCLIKGKVKSCQESVLIQIDLEVISILIDLYTCQYAYNYVNI